LPLPVVGGYLGYIGYFCFAAGLASATGKGITTPLTWYLLFDLSLLGKLALLTLFTLILCVVHFKVHHFSGLPTVLTLLPVLFFCALPLFGTTPDECRETGWLPPPIPSAGGFNVFELFNPHLVHWEFVWNQWLSMLGLVIVVTFGSSLDIAAIQAAMEGEELDYNVELVTVGIANLVSGLTGGATGSYIFSQTIFSQKRGVRSLANGLVVAVGELVLFGTTFDILKFLPSAYIGAIMCMFGLDIMSDWLLFSRSLMSRSEYALVWITFIIIMWRTGVENFGLIDGMAGCTLIAATVFAVHYATKHPGWKVIGSRSSLWRPKRERVLLDKVSGQCLAISITGFPFFGSSLQMAQAIGAKSREQGTEYVCLDFSKAFATDSTAAGQIKFLVCGLLREGVHVVISSVHSKQMQELILAHEVPGAENINETLDDALQWCETEILQQQGVTPRSSCPATFAEVIFEHLDISHPSVSEVEAVSVLENSCVRKNYAVGDLVFKDQDEVDSILIVVSGALRLTCSRRHPSGAPIHPPRTAGVGSICGTSHLYTRHVHDHDAVAYKDPCVVYSLSRKEHDALEKKPLTAYLLQKVLISELAHFKAQYLVSKEAAY